MDEKSLDGYRLRIHRVSNDTFIASVVGDHNVSIDHSLGYHKDYDDKGALYYVIAIVLIYGCSVMMMIASFVKKSGSDHGLSKYMSDLDAVRRVELRQQKFKTRLAMMQTKKLHSMIKSIGGNKSGTAQTTEVQTVTLPDSQPQTDRKQNTETVFTFDTNRLLTTEFNSQKDNRSSWSLQSYKDGEDNAFPLLTPTLPESETPSPCPSPQVPRSKSPQDCPEVSVEIDIEENDLPPAITIQPSSSDERVDREEPLNGGQVDMALTYVSQGQLHTLHEEDEEATFV